MKEFTLPLGMFQVQMPAPVVEAVEPLRMALEALAQVTRESPLGNLQHHSKEVDAWTAEFAYVVERIKRASDELQLRLKSTEFPSVLPPRIYDLIYASLVAQTFGLGFKIADYTLERTNANLAYWWVALLSACADAFVDWVFAVVPHFPRAREKERPPLFG